LTGEKRLCEIEEFIAYVMKLLTTIAFPKAPYNQGSDNPEQED